MTQNEKLIFDTLISCEIGSYTCLYGPKRVVVTISNLVALTGLTKYAARKALKGLIADGLVEYTSLGCSAVVSFGEVPELVYEAGPPINGYALTGAAFKTQDWVAAYAAWCKSMEEWANGD